MNPPCFRRGKVQGASMREYELEVLEQYDIEVISTRKTRGAYFCNTKEGLMLLGPAGISVGRAPLMYVLLCYLESRHGMKVDTPIFTKAGKLFSVSQDGTKYMLKKWVSGRECEVRRERDVLEAAQALGLLHQRMDWGEILGDGAFSAARLPKHLATALMNLLWKLQLREPSRKPENTNFSPVKLFLDCLRYWVTDYRVDGFRFDLASILGRNEDGSPMSQPPLLQSLAFDPILGNVKLIAEAWNAGGLYQVGSFPSWRRWDEWNGRYRDDMRRFLKGDDGLHETALKRIFGSPDLYNPQYRGGGKCFRQFSDLS